MHISLAATLALAASMFVAPTSAEATADPACEAGTHYVDESNGGRTVLRFTTTTPCEWARPTGVSAVDVLVVGGGGGGGAIAGAGGGGGAVVTNAITLNSTMYTITVGAGGTGASMRHGADSDVATNTFTAGTNGGASSISGADVTITALGGGVGGSWDGSDHWQAPGSGGSGGGSGSIDISLVGTGNPGGNGGSAAANGQPHATGGGGGAGGDGGNGSGGDAGAGGYWVNSDIITRGSPEGYGGGGGGSTHGTWTGSTLDIAGRSGGSGGGGGDGGSPTQSASGTVLGGAGADGRGGGGGGAANNLVVSGGGSTGGDGGGGVVMIAWARTAQTITFTRPTDRTLSPIPFDIAATSDSGLSVAVTSSTPTVCTVSGVTVTMLTTGTCTLDADQPGDIVFLPATTVSRSFTISPTSSSPSSSLSTSSSTSSSTSTTTTTSTATSTTNVPDSTDVSGCPCLVDDSGTSVPITTDATPAGRAPGGITVGDDTSTITIGDIDRGPDDPSDVATTWVNGDGALTAQPPGALMISGSGALPGTTATGTLTNGTTGTTTVNPDGTWQVDVPVPAGTSGTSTLTSTWTDADGDGRTLTVPVVVLPSGDATTAPRQPVDGALSLLGPGEVLAFGQNGVTVDHTRTHDTTNRTISISANGVVLEISPDTGCRITDDGRLDCEPPARLRLTASGMTPGSIVDVWAMAGTSPLASVRVGPDGYLDAVIDIPASFASSLAVLQFDTVDGDGRALSVALGMASGTLPMTGPTTDRLNTWVMLTLAGGLFLGLLARRRPATATGPMA